MDNYSAAYQAAQIPAVASMIAHNSMTYTTGEHFNKGIMPALQ